ncbi:MAG: TIGR03752 family integrating conjugative element protein [Gammaproteobacteria bacterium]
MAMHNTNSILKYVVPSIILVVIILYVMSLLNHAPNTVPQKAIPKEITVKNTAAHDSAAESLDTLTAELSETKQKISDVSKHNDELKKQNDDLLNKNSRKQGEETSQLAEDIRQLKNQMQVLVQKPSANYAINIDSGVQPITTVSDLTQTGSTKLLKQATNANVLYASEKNRGDKIEKAIPYYTIPANGTSVKDRLMTALVGRIPVKGIVTDPYPFKIVVSDDNLAANGLRIPHLLQMIVSGYCEGDLNLVSVRGWVTSLTFVFDDGTISTTTSNDNDIGNFTKANSLGYLSDKNGNPFISGKLITNAPTYLTGNVLLGATAAGANAYAQSQTTSTSSFLGNTNTAVTGSQGKFIAGQMTSGAANEAQQWWHDREQQSFDAIYVPPVDQQGQYIEIAVNFAKEIHIDYNPKGRKLSYAHHYGSHHHLLD